MKKLLLGILSVLLIVQFSYAQPVSDNAVIPMGITLSSVLRLNVVSGGNIEFVFNSISDFQNGLAGDMYRTNLTVASSTNWSLSVYAADFAGSAGNFQVGIVDYCVEDNGSGNTIAATDPGAGNGKGSVYTGTALYTGGNTGDFISLANAAAVVLSPATDGNDGVAADNNFYIRWRCGIPTTATPAGPGLINSWAGTGPGRSSTNVLVTLTAL